MNLTRNKSLCGFTLYLFSIVLLQYGCATGYVIRDEPGKDVSAIKPGISKEEAENILGAPNRQWTTSLNIRYCVYRYDAGMKLSTSDKVAVVLFDIMTLGQFSLRQVMPPNVGATRLGPIATDKIAVAYDQNNLIVGVFDHFEDFDVLPADGRSVK